MSMVTPAVQKAAEYIRGNLDKGIWQDGSLLPTTRSLSQVVGVSRTGILQAIALLKSESRITAIQRGRIRAGTGPLSGAIPAESGTVWQMKRTALEKDILSGKYSHDNKLPSMKELCIRYGVSYETMRKVLHALVADGAVRRRGKAYALITHAGHPFQQRIVFITFATTFPRLSALNQGRYAVLELLEHECFRRELKLEIVEIDFYNPVEVLKAINGQAINAPALGYFLDLWWYASDPFRHGHIDLLSRLSDLKRPVAILDEIGDFGLPSQSSRNPLMQVYRIEGKKAGARVARILLDLGHRNVAFISPSHETSWSQQRLDGLIEQFSKAGCGSGVKAVVAGQIELTHEHAFALSGFSDKLIRKLLGLGERSNASAKEIYQSIVKFKARSSPDQWKLIDVGEIRNNLGIVSDMDKRKPSMKLFERVSSVVFADIAILMSSRIRAPLFSKALSYPDVTAWICVSDGVALTALQFLRDRRIDVPGRISIVGFNNVPEEVLQARLTSFDFNAHGFIHHMLNHLLRPPKPRGPYKHVPIEVEGMVLQRATTAPPDTPESR